MSAPPPPLIKSIGHVLLIGDLAGPEHFHVGDEAMLECNLQMLRRLLPAASFSLVSRNPAASADLYGTRAVARPGFSTVSADRQAELHQIDHWLELAGQQPEQLPEALQALLQADLLVISGGGNLSSTWPEYILERLALVRLARQQGIPLLVFGQTLGPQLDEVDRALVSEILMAAQWVGLREAGSVAQALELGVPLANIDYQLDDAMALAPRPSALLASAWAEEANRGPLIALTLHPLFVGAERECWLNDVAAELDQVVAELDARLLFIPHVRDQQESGDAGDRAVGLALAARLQQPAAMSVLDVQGSGETAWLTQQADLVVSSRYHPLVFALARQRPCLGLPTDHYTLIKLQGALSHAGCEADLLVIRDRRWDGLGRRIIAQIRAASIDSQDRYWSTRLEQHGRDREQRLAAWLYKQQQTPAHDNTELVLALARLLDGAAQTRLALAREAELRDAIEHWQQSAQEAETYALDLVAGLRRETDESASLRVALEASLRRAELAERYAQGLEAARQSEAAQYARNLALERSGRAKTLLRLRRLMRRLSRSSR